ncbi:MAG: ATP-binding cassette domain-containing protein [bacterium]
MSVLRLTELICETGTFLLTISHWEARAGEFSVLLGRNGAGKSTMLKAIAGDLPCTGERVLHGRLVEKWDPLDRARHMAVLPQASDLHFAFQAEDVVALGAMPLQMGWRELNKAIRNAMADADCADLAGKPYPQLSGGEKQRIHFARVLLQLTQAQKSPLLLLDEPTSAQDLKQQHKLLGQVTELCRQYDYTAIAVLHDLNQALRYSDQCTLIENGRVVIEGVPEQVLTPDLVHTTWDYPAKYAITSEAKKLIY